MTLIELQACVADRWSPKIGDPGLTGWLTVVAYVVTALLAAAVWRRLAGRSGRVFWALLVITLGFLAANKQLDLQTALTVAGKCLANAQGWYANRRIVQAGFIAALLAVMMLGLFVTILALRGSLGRNLLALLGLVTVLSFVMVRAVSIHRFDHMIGAQSFGISNNFLLENAGLVLIAANAVILLRRYGPTPRV